MNRNPIHLTSGLVILLLVVCFVSFTGHSVWADDQGESPVSETPQGMLIPLGTGLEPDNTADPVVSTEKDANLVAAMENVQKARTRLLLLPPDTNAFQQAQVQLASAEERLDRTFSAVVGINAADIQAMRVNGMKWVEILQLLNVDPGVFGLEGHYAECPTDRIPLLATAGSANPQFGEMLHTARSLKGGLAKGHGVSVAGHSLQGQGLGANKLKAGTGGPDTNFATDGNFQDIGKRAGIGNASGNGDGNADKGGGGMNGRGGDGPSGSGGGKNGKSV